MKNKRSYFLYTILAVLYLSLFSTPVHKIYANEHGGQPKENSQQIANSENIAPTENDEQSEDESAEEDSEEAIPEDTDQEAEKKVFLQKELNSPEKTIQSIESEINQADKSFESQKAAIYPAHTENELEERGKEAVDTLASAILVDHPESSPDFTHFQRALTQKIENDGWGDPRTKYRQDPVKYVASYLIDIWNLYSSNLIQAAAKEQFHLHKARVAWTEESLEAELKDHKEYLPTIGRVLDSMRKLTLQYFKKRGIKYVNLYRGITLDQEITREGLYFHQLAPLSSFSLSKSVASNFAYTSKQHKRYGYILYKRFPVERIVSFVGTGLGTFYEYELVVLGPQYELDSFYVIPVEEIVWEETEKKFCWKKKASSYQRKWVDHVSHLESVPTSERFSWLKAPDFLQKAMEEQVQERAVDKKMESEKKANESTGFWAYIQRLFEALCELFARLFKWLSHDVLGF